MNKSIKRGATALLLHTEKRDFYEKFGFELYKDNGEEFENDRYDMTYYVK